MTFGGFDCPVGAAADLRELEYISALHQTAEPYLRNDASISSADILLYLRSRYGLDITKQDAIDVVRGLGGTKDTLRMRDVSAMVTMAGDKLKSRKEAKAKKKRRKKDRFLGVATTVTQGVIGGTRGSTDLGARSSAAQSSRQKSDSMSVEESFVEGASVGAAAAAAAAAAMAEELVSIVEEAPSKSETQGGKGSKLVPSSDMFSASIVESVKRGGNNSGDDNDDDIEDTEFDEEEGDVDHLWDRSLRFVDKDRAGNGDDEEEDYELDTTAASKNRRGSDKKNKTLIRRKRSRDPEDEYLDLVQLTSVMLISTLLRAAEEVDLANGFGVRKLDRPELPLASPLHDPLQAWHNHMEKRRRKMEDRDIAFRDEQRPTIRRVIRNVLRLLLSGDREGKERHLTSTTRADGGEGGEVDVVGVTTATAGNGSQTHRTDIAFTSRLKDGLPALREMVLTEDNVRALLEAYDEYDAAENGQLVREMILAAGGPGTVLDEEAFARALVSDVRAYEPRWEEEQRETFVDVWGFEPVDANKQRRARRSIYLRGPVAKKSVGGVNDVDVCVREEDVDSIDRRSEETDHGNQKAPSANYSSPHIIMEGSTSNVEASADASTELARIRGGGLDDQTNDSNDIGGEMARRSSYRDRENVHASVVDELSPSRNIELFHYDGDGVSPAAHDEDDDGKPPFGMSTRMFHSCNENVFDDESSSFPPVVSSARDATDGGVSLQMNPDSSQLLACDDASGHLPSAAPFKATISQKETHGILYGQEESISEDDVKIPVYIRTAPYVDYAVDEFKSLPYTMGLWIFFSFVIGIATTLMASAGWNLFTCEPSFGCTLVDKVWTWIALGLLLITGGMVVIVPVSFGNNPYPRSSFFMWVSFVSIAVYAVTPPVFLKVYRDGIPHSADGVLTDVENAALSFTMGLAVFISTVLGTLIFLRVTYELLAFHLPFDWMKTGSSFSPSRGSSDLKLSATHKMNTLVENAHRLHCHKAYGKKYKTAMQNFVLDGESHEPSGGFFWTWKEILCGRRLSKKHGVWIFSRLCVGQEGQIILLIVWCVIIRREIYESAAEADKTRLEIMEDEDEGPLKDWALRVLPEGWMILVSLMPAWFFSTIAGFWVLLLYVPSTVSTILKLRSGVIGSLHEPRFLKFRKSTDTIFYNVSNMVYSLLGSVGLLFVLVGLLIFFFVWPPTSDFMVSLLAWFLGLMITILLKMILMMIARRNVNVAFFRSKPMSANFWALAMECWNIGLGGGVVLGRITQFLLASAVWVGRIDVTFLDEGVNFLGYAFDYVPTNYRKEILVHEAHRHPFIDRLGAMYMMRLKHGTGFSSDAGACWRRLFVLALMPWLMKYRQDDGDSNDSDKDEMEEIEMLDESLAPSDHQPKEMGKKLLRHVAGRMKSLAIYARDQVVDENVNDYERAKRRQNLINRRKSV